MKIESNTGRFDPVLIILPCRKAHLKKEEDKIENFLTFGNLFCVRNSKNYPDCGCWWLDLWSRLIMFKNKWAHSFFLDRWWWLQESSKSHSEFVVTWEYRSGTYSEKTMGIFNYAAHADISIFQVFFILWMWLCKLNKLCFKMK